MEEKVVTMKEFKRDAFFKKLKDGAKKIGEKALEAAEKGVDYAIEHPGQAIAAVSAFGVAAGKVAKIQQVKAEDRRRKRDFYDPRTGRWCSAKKDLSPDQEMYIERRHRVNKETYREILYDMGLLK